LQDLALSECPHHRVGDDVHQKLDCALLLDFVTKPWIALVSIVLGSTFMAAPGCSVLATMRPTMRASVVSASKYMSAFSPTRPTFFISCMLAMPCTTVQKMIGAMIILIVLMKASPRGFICSPSSG